MSQYELLGFERSRSPKKKYDAILSLKSIYPHDIVRVPFGDVRYAQYEDTTGLRLYSRLDHLSPARRDRFRKRHAGFLRSGYFSPSYFAYFYLW